MKTLTRIITAVLLGGIFLFITSCEYDDEYNYRPPQGQGALIIDNNTEDDIYVYIDGRLATRAPYSSEQEYDLEPGEHRVILDQRGGDRYYGDDVDILENKLTIWDVYFGLRDYDVHTWID